jgi:hypothetical protein
MLINKLVENKTGNSELGPRSWVEAVHSEVISLFLRSWVKCLFPEIACFLRIFSLRAPLGVVFQ